MQRTARWLPPVWAAFLTVLMLGPALGPGYVLSYDMVWVPDLALRPDFVGLGSALPRAVPSDAVVAVLDEVVPGAVLQKVVLVGALLTGALGAARLAPQHSLTGRLVAVTVYTWNPFVVERLALGHWPVLLGYGVLPWIVVVARTARRRGRLPAVMWLLGVVGSLSAGAGLATAFVVLALTVRRGATRLNLSAVALVVAVNLPWAASGLLHAAVAATDPTGAEVFGLNRAGPLSAPLAALGLGGTWNVEVLLPSRESSFAVVALAVLGLLVVAGISSWWGTLDVRERVGLVAAWITGLVLALLTWAAPGLTAWVGEAVPGGGLLRDGSRWLALCAPAVASLAAYGAAWIAGAVTVPAARAGTAVTLVLAPVAVMPDAALGLSGRLRAVDYPASYAAAREAVAETAGGGAGDVLVLPFTSYRAPEWNGGRKVLDPLGRYLPLDYVVSDELVVSGARIQGEDPRAEEVRAVLELPTARARAAGLAELGIGAVVHDRRAGEAPDVAGTEVPVSPAGVEVVTLPSVEPRTPPTGWRIAMGLAWAAFLGALLRGLLGALPGVARGLGPARPVPKARPR